jgi:phage tail sheath gpL-like
VDLAFRAVRDDITRDEHGRLVARDGSGQTEMKDYLAKFVQENPELLPARSSGGSGATLTARGQGTAGTGIDLDRIKPGMDPEEMDRVRREIMRVASQTTRL